MEHLAAQVTQATDQLSQMFGMQSELLEVTELATLAGGEDVTILISFAGGLRGNVALGFGQQESKQLVSAMMGGMEIKELDDMAQSALGEFANMLVGTALNGLRCNQTIHLSPPTLIMGKEVLLIISRVQACRMVFTLNTDKFTLMFSLE